MKDLQNIVYKFMEREQVTLKQALLQSSLGMCAKTGDIAEIVRGVVYSDYPYTEERKKRNAEHLGELLFYWVMLASTVGMSPEEIMSQYIVSYIKKNKITREDELKILNAREKLSSEDREKHAEGHKQAQASILEMLKYVKENEPAVQPSLTTMGRHLREKEKSR